MTTIEQECAAARKACVLFEHPNRGVIEVSGNDRVSFLHNILTNDIKNLTPGKGIPACLLNAHAKIIAQVNVLYFEKFIWLAVDYALKGNLIAALNNLIIMEDVVLKDRSDERKLISIHGPKTKEMLTILFKKDPPNEMLAHEKINPMSFPRTRESSMLDPRFRGGDNNEISGVCVRINLTGEIGYGLLAQKSETDNLKLAIQRIGASFDLIEIHADTLETLRIEAGIPRYGIDLDESNIPLEVRLDQTISFTKGCFPGQEIIARLDSRGGVTRKLSGLILKGEIAPKKGARILKDNAEAGLITSAVFSPTLKKTVAMGFLKKEHWEPGTNLIVENEGNKIPARVTGLPCYTSRT
jgi:folate-binding protein YgfZ